MATSDMNQQNPLLTLAGQTSQGGPNKEDDEDAELATMSLIDHLEELRWRIFKSLIAIAVGTIIAFIFRDYIVHFLELPLPKQADALPGVAGGKLVVTGIAEGFTVMLLVSFATGVMLSLPVILYQAWAFISPGLYAHEKKYAVPFIFIGVALFAIGIFTGYVVLRFPVQWLVTFAANSFTELVTANSYFTFVAFFVLAFGLVFELPLVLTFMAQVGLVSSDSLKKARAKAHIGMWIAATFLTPGADIYSPIILGVAMSFLYELTIFFIRITRK
jgi:sec-independent protein translocase protein TatC